MNKLFTQLLELRGIDESFLYPKYEDSLDPFLLPDLEKAISRIEKARQNKEKVLIYGDYDVDGVTASTLMEEALRLTGIHDLDIMLPDRFSDGYGMSERLVERAHSEQINLVITVDCGSRNHEIVSKLSQLKIDTIITDHHECDDSLPEAVAVVNPKRKDFDPNSSLHDLAGVGVAFKVAQGLAKMNLLPNGQEKWLLDLVVIGTLCDNMKLSQENRILCFYGLKVLNKTRRLGLRELMRLAGVKRLSSEAIGFQIGPRLNASGRLETADLSLSLLRTNSATEATALALKLEELNKARRHKQQIATEEISKRELPDSPVIIEQGEWHEGIIGIVAGRLVERYHRPSFVLTNSEPGILKGSGRSFGDFNLAEALNFAKDAIIAGGGHAGAAGVQLEADKIELFRTKINEYYRSLKLSDQEKYFRIDSDLSLSDISTFSLDLLDDLSLLEPFGVGNSEPVFCVKNAKIIDFKRLGDKRQHLSLTLSDTNRKILKCIAFFAPLEWLDLDLDLDYNFLVRPIENEWNGIRSVEARICDIISL
ncbi:MAG: single-stranded-DNA-specific exonuclease RecJ [Candidatus Saccharibacteria bacterium]|nr:single-stranded-DNA-specific exonuclease RecJ [Candidatus Saccharibacteria bacterium]